MLFLGDRKMRLLHQPARILKVHMKALTGFSHLYHQESLNHTPQGCILEMALAMGTVSCGNSEGLVRCLSLLDPAQAVTCSR